MTETRTESGSLERPVTPVGQEADLRLLADVANRHARELWGSAIGRGEPIPAVDALGQPVAYVFPYIRDAEHHPDDDTIAEQLAALDGADRVDARDAFEKRFGAVYVAVGAAPRVLLVLHHLHPFFTAGPAAAEQARREAGGRDVHLDRYRFDGPTYEAFEFLVGDRRVVVPVHGRPPPDRDTFPLPAVVPPNLGEAQKAPVVDTAAPLGPVMPVTAHRAPLPAGPTTKKIPSWELVPPVPYTWWCVPTATTW